MIDHRSDDDVTAGAAPTSAITDPRVVGPLAGVRVIDMTQYVAGPYCSMLLGDLGADVIKVERPGQGDVYRVQGPQFLRGESVTFLALNRNKRSVVLDMTGSE